MPWHSGASSVTGTPMSNAWHAANLVVARQRAGQLLETLQDRDGFELLP